MTKVADEFQNPNKKIIFEINLYVRAACAWIEWERGWHARGTKRGWNVWIEADKNPTYSSSNCLIREASSMFCCGSHVQSLKAKEYLSISLLAEHITVYYALSSSTQTCY